MSISNPRSDEIRLQAEAELAEERRRQLVDQEKQRITRRRWWHIFTKPFITITVTWRSK